MNTSNSPVKGFLGKITLEEERPFVPEDFQEHRLTSLDDLNQLQANLGNLDSSCPDVISEVLCLCGENMNPNDLWVTNDHVLIAQAILNQVTGAESIDAYLMSKEDTVIKQCLKKLHTLLEENWKLYPGSVSAFHWLLCCIHFPHMGRYIQEFLPFILRFTDDWIPENKIRGAEMILHLVEECSWNTELNATLGQELLPKTLFQMLHTRDASVVDVSLKTLILFYQKSRNPNLIGHELLPDLLNSIAITSDIYLRRAYSRYFSSVIRSSGIHLAPWISKIVQVISHCAIYPDPFNENIRINMLKGLCEMLDIVEENGLQEIFKKYVRDTLGLLIRLLYELSKKDTRNDQLLQLARDNFHRVAKCFSKEFCLLCEGMDKLEVNNVFNKIIQTSFSIVLQ